MAEETYACVNCRKGVKLDLRRAKKIICPYCGYRILEKRRAATVKKVIVR